MGSMEAYHRPGVLPIGLADKTPFIMKDDLLCSDLLKLATYDKALIDQRSATLAIYHKVSLVHLQVKLLAQGMHKHMVYMWRA